MNKHETQTPITTEGSQSEKSILERQKYALNQLSNLTQMSNDRLTFGNLNIVDRYIENRLKICVKFRSKATGSEFKLILGATKVFKPYAGYSTLKNNFGLTFGHDLGEVCCGWVENKMTSSTRANGMECSFINNDGVEVGNNVKNDGDDRNMFVFSIQVMKQPEEFIPTSIRLQCSNHLLPIRTNKFCFLSKFIFESIDVFAKREIDFIAASRMLDCQSTSKVVQARSQIMENLSNNNLEFFGWRNSQRNLKYLYAKLTIYLGYEGIRFRVEESGDFPFQIEDLGFGPFDLDTNVF